MSIRAAGSSSRSNCSTTPIRCTCVASATRQCAILQAAAVMRAPHSRPQQRCSTTTLNVHSVEAEPQATTAAAAAAAAAAAVTTAQSPGSSSSSGSGSSSMQEDYIAAVEEAAASQLESPPPSATAAAAEAAAAAAEAREEEAAEQEEAPAGAGEVDLAIRAVESQAELQAVARLRAEAYYANDHSRFAASFKRQFAAQEVESLRQRTSTSSSTGRPQICDCLVAVGGPRQEVLGCIDIRLPQTATGMRAVGVPEGDAAGCYLLNVVVAEGWRGMGVGRQLMRAAMQQAVHRWGAERLYTHVEADNEVAVRLYKGCGFRDHSEEARFDNSLSLGRLVLLMASGEQVPPPGAAAAGGAPTITTTSSTTTSSSSSSSAEL